MPALPVILDAFGQPAKRGTEPPPVRPQRFRDSSTGMVVYAGLQARDLPVESFEEYANPEQVRQVLRGHSQGDFSRSAKLADAMLADDRIAGCLESRFAGLQALPFAMEPAGGDRPNQRKQKRVAKKMMEEWERSFPLEDRVNLLIWGYMLGVGLGQLVWEKSSTWWRPRLQVWHPAFVSWSWTDRSYYVQTMHGRTRVVPGDGQWMLFTPYGYEMGWSRALVRRLAVPFCCRLFGTRDLARASEVHGNIARVGRYPRDADKSEIAAFLMGLSRLATDSVVGIPINMPADPAQNINQVPQYDAGLLHPSSAGNERIFEVLLNRSDSAISIAITGQNLTTEVKGGSRAAATVHEAVRSDIIRRDGIQASAFFKDQGLEPATAVNYGSSALAPKPTWDTKPPEDQKARAETLKSVGEGVAALRDKAGMDVDEDAIAESFGIRLRVNDEGESEPVPGEMLPDDLVSGVVRRDERRRRLRLKPLGGARGKELLGEAAKQVEIPPEASAAEGKKAPETLLNLLSLRTTALQELATPGGELKPEARWFAKRHEVSLWAPAIRQELVRRGALSLHAAQELGPTRPLRDALAYMRQVEADAAERTQKVLNPMLESVLREVEASTSFDDLRERLVRLYEAKDMELTEEAFADVLQAAQNIAWLAGNHSVLEESTAPISEER